MAVTATVRVMTPDEIAARAGGEAPFVRVPERLTYFAEREMRLRQLARGHALEQYLEFLASLVHAQHEALKNLGPVKVPSAEEIAQAHEQGAPPLDAGAWTRDPMWRDVLQTLIKEVQDKSPAHVAAILERLSQADTQWLEDQAQGLITGDREDQDFGAAPLIGAALQVYFTHLLLTMIEEQGGKPHTVIARIPQEALCPCCGSLPTVSVTRTTGESLGQRYLHCSLCGLEWHMLRIKCTHCLSSKSIAFQSVATEGQEDMSATRAKVQAETCDDCGHYLKIMHTDRDPFVDPVADDVATLTLDIMVSDDGKLRHGLNYMMLFGEAEPSAAQGEVESSKVHGEADVDASLGTTQAGIDRSQKGLPPDPGRA